ncbi:MAG: DUF6600 domain-containing protein [Ignavibacteria bacterium]
MKAKRNLMNALEVSKSILVIVLISLLVSSCGKEDKIETQNQKPSDESAQYKESNEDFLTVDYKYFYDELSTGGEWIEVNAKDIGLNIDSKKLSEIKSENTKFIAEIFGIKTAVAQTDADIFNLFVWRPTAELINKELTQSSETTPNYIPYTNGEWLNTDAGWYFKAPTSQEEITSHYGRWSDNEELGNVWLPGKTWSPAWVEWREDKDNIAWAPIPPGGYIENDAVITPEIKEDKFTIVEKKYFTDADGGKHRYQYVENKNKIMIKDMVKKDGVMIKNKTVINKGPDVEDIEKSSGKKIKQYKINKSDKKDETGVKDDVISVYKPEFKKTDDAKKEPVSKPEKRVSYKDAKRITKDEKKELKEQDKEQKQQEKEIRKDEKQKEKDIKKEEKKENKDLKKEEKKEEKELKKEKEKKNEKKTDDKDTKKENKNKDNKSGDNDKGNKENKGKNK